METVVTLTINPAVDLFTETDRIEPEHKLRCTAPRIDPGGGGINVSRALRILGASSLAVYAAGGPPGDMLRHRLDGEGLTHRAVGIREWTRQSIMVAGRTPKALYRFILPGPTLSEQEWGEALAVVARIDPAPVVVVGSGSLAPGVPVDFYARLVEVANRRGSRAVIDASGEALKAAVAAGPFLLKPNRRELGFLTGEAVNGPAEAARAARSLLARGVTAVMVSLGADGAVLVSAEGDLRLTAPKVSVASSVGAGDSMVAGLVLALSRGESLEQAARWGMAAGTAAVTSPGTGLCRRVDVEQLLDQIRAEPL